jgi:hypothetical protein
MAFASQCETIFGPVIDDAQEPIVFAQPTLIDTYALRQRRFADYYTKYYIKSRLVSAARPIAHGRKP